MIKDSSKMLSSFLCSPFTLIPFFIEYFRLLNLVVSAIGTGRTY
jgi:hypothetical protein